MEPEKKSNGAMIGSIIIIIIVVIAAIMLFRSKSKEEPANGSLEPLTQELESLNFEDLDVPAVE